MSGGPTVVKLGGSHAFSAHLPRWIEALEAAAGEVVVVPGGGPFADAVREAQPRMGYVEPAAHVMAMLAMAQYGVALASLSGIFDVVFGIAALRRALSLGRVPVWSPVPMALRDKSVPQSWAVTSDSLALWLAHRLAAPRLLLVKQRWPEPGATTAQELAEEALVDAAFPSMDRGSEAACWVCGPECFANLGAFLAGRPTPMLRLDG